MLALPSSLSCWDKMGISIRVGEIAPVGEAGTSAVTAAMLLGVVVVTSMVAGAATAAAATATMHANFSNSSLLRFWPVYSENSKCAWVLQLCSAVCWVEGGHCACLRET
jgi:hypothetical protein